VKLPQLRIHRLYLIQLGCSGLGIAISLYLLLHHTRVKLGIQDASSFCSFGKLADCDIVNVSRFSEVAGVPLASIGAFYFFFLLVMGFLFPPRHPNYEVARKVLVGLSTLALMVDLILLIGIQWLQLGSFCLLCILTYGANLGYLIAGAVHPAPLSSTKVLKELSNAKIGFAVLCLAFFGASLTFFPSWIQSHSGGWEQKQKALSELLQKWKALPSIDFPADSSDGVWGADGAKIQIVVFSDFQCPFCRKSAFTLHTLLPSFKDTVRVTFKHFPLDSACNPAVAQAMHPYACSLARLAVCAQKKGKFWDFHDTVFFKIPETVFQEGWENIRLALQTLFSESEIEACLRSDESLQKVRADTELGLRTGIQGTPATFINGKAVSIPLDIDVLGKIVQAESGI